MISRLLFVIPAVSCLGHHSCQKLTKCIEVGKHGQYCTSITPMIAINAITGENPVAYLSSQSLDSQVNFFTAAGLVKLDTFLVGPNFTLKEGVEPGK